MKMPRYYTKTTADPYANQRYVERVSSIREKSGSQSRQLIVLAPEDWSQTAVDILTQKYMRRTGVPETGTETDARQVFDRITGCWAFWGLRGGYFDTPAEADVFRQEMAYMLAHQIGAPNSPQWFNTGLHHAYGIEGPAQGLWRVNPATGLAEEVPTAYVHPLVSACFIQSIDDSLVNAGGIMDLWVREARLFKFGAGSGSNFSALRGRGEALSGGGTSSGLMSWLKIGDRSAGAIKSGGTTRRAAKMVILNLDHPDIEAFIQWKVQEEQKVAALMVGSHVCAQHLNTVIEACWLHEEGQEQVQPNPRYNTALNEALRAARAARVPETYLQRALALAKVGTRSFAFSTYDLHYEGEGYDSVSGQNANNSVRIPNTFFAALDADVTWDLHARTTGHVTKTLRAQDLWNQICAAAWQCADPGLQFDDIINDWHTTPAQGRIHGSNPCVTGDTLIATSTGWQRIAQLVGTTPDVIDDNQPYRATRVFPTGRKPVYLLTTRDGYQLRLTADHRVPTVERGEVAAQWLRPGDKLFLRGSWFGTAKIDERLAFAIGAAVGDGCLSHYAGASGITNTIILSMHRDEAPILRDIADFINQQKTYAKVANGVGFRPVSVWYSKSGSRVACAWPPMVALFQQYAILDKGSQHKRFTDKVFDLDKPSLAALLRGLFTTDGTVANCSDKSHNISLDSSSLELLQQVQVLLLSFRIKSKLYRNRRAGKLSSILPDGRGGLKEYPVQEMYSLRISRHSRLVFGCHIGFHPESAKHKALRNLNKAVSVYSDRMHTQVESLQYIGEEEVYDLTQPGTHHFIGNGIRIHNCSEYLSNDNTACNLASLNLVKFLRADGTFDLEGYQHAIACWTLALDITVSFSAYPSRAIAERTYELRQLGLGYANLGALLMRLGLPYDSPHGRAYAAGLTAIMTGHAYAISALLAKDLGPFAGYAPNRESMLRVIRNHHAAAHAQVSGYDGLSILPQPLDLAHSPLSFSTSASQAWTAALTLGERWGYRNAQVTVIAPTGTIGLVMDCDTTGVEPDFALVKYKMLTGGGTMKLINQSVPDALRHLGYAADKIHTIIHYAVGHGSLEGSPTITVDRLRALGLPESALTEMLHALSHVLDARMAMTGDQILSWAREKFGHELQRPGFDLLSRLGFSPAEIEAASAWACGTLTLEGAPHLQAAHLPVFDCAVPGGAGGTRSIAPEGHVRMLSAVQPFISGGLSKTVNLPATADIEDIARIYRLAHGLGVKCIAVYRDGCKLSQPLSAIGAETLQQAIETNDIPAVAQELAMLAVGRHKYRPLPNQRRGITQKVGLGGHKIYIRTGEYADGTLGEIFLDMHKEGAAFRSLMNCFAIAISLGLQYGVPLEEFVEAYIFTRFEPNGPVINHNHIKMSTSIMDLIFRHLAITYLDRHDLAQVPVTSDDLRGDLVKPYLRPDAMRQAFTDPPPSRTTHEKDLRRQAKLKGFEGEACNQCGSFTMVRTGTCLRCSECGASVGGCS